eukprot:1754059-Pleurochrysis_carterae.AAC.1
MKLTDTDEAHKRLLRRIEREEIEGIYVSCSERAQQSLMQGTTWRRGPQELARNILTFFVKRRLSYPCAESVLVCSEDKPSRSWRSKSSVSIPRELSHSNACSASINKTHVPC